MENEYKACPYCGEKIKKIALKCRFCQSTLKPLTRICENKECGKEIDYDNWTCPHCKYVQHEGEEEESMLSAGWIIGSILVPLVGIIGGIWGLCKGREGAGGILAIGLVVWLVLMIIFL